MWPPGSPQYEGTVSVWHTHEWRCWHCEWREGWVTLLVQSMWREDTKETPKPYSSVRRKHKPRKECAKCRTGVNVSIKQTQRDLELQRDTLLIKQKGLLSIARQNRMKETNGKEGREWAGQVEIFNEELSLRVCSWLLRRFSSLDVINTFINILYTLCYIVYTLALLTFLSTIIRQEKEKKNHIYKGPWHLKCDVQLQVYFVSESETENFIDSRGTCLCYVYTVTQRHTKANNINLEIG